MIEAFDSKAGYGKFKFSPYREGGVVKGIKIVLNGIIRIHGKVTDPNGNPIDKINIDVSSGSNIFSNTDEQGRFDLGKFPIKEPQSTQGTISFYAPRPGGTILFTGKNQWINDIENYYEKIDFFHHYQKKYNIEPGKDIEINVTLEPTDLITLCGTVTDANNNFLENAEISLHIGNANPKDWFLALYLQALLEYLNHLFHQNIF